MPSTFKYKCHSCECEFERFFHSAHYNKEGIRKEIDETPLSCPECQADRLNDITGTQFARSFTVSESHKPGISTRTDQFLSNAEENRVKKLNERFKDKKEQSFYSGDSDAKTLKAKDKEIKRIDSEHKKKVDTNT